MPRRNLTVTCAVIRALFIREALAKTMIGNFSWLWLLFEPIALVTLIVAIRHFFFPGKLIIGADFVPWLIVGLLAFSLFRDNMANAPGAIDANKGLFTYRQVIPIDTVIARTAFDGVLRTLVLLLFVIFASPMGINLLPNNPMGAIFVWITIWTFGTAVGLVLSALKVFIPEIGRVARIAGLPLLICSAVMFPATLIPHAFREYALLNPLLHVIEYLRFTFFSDYKSIDGVSLWYPWSWTLVTLTLGILLHLRYKIHLKS